jgi:hypothetical protein
VYYASSRAGIRQYKFPQTSKFAAGGSIAVANLAIYDSIGNITEKRDNNVITLTWVGTDYIFISSTDIIQLVTCVAR